MEQMEKRYGLPTAIAMVIGIVIGSGIFIKGGKVLNLTGGNLAQGVLVVAIVGVICIICSLVFAELGSKYERVNGVVDYAEMALGNKFAYYVGWFMTTIYTPVLAATLAFFAAMFFCALFGISTFDFANGSLNPVTIGVGAAFLMIGYAINILSPKLAGKLQVSMTVIKLVPILIMGIGGTIAGLVNGNITNVLEFVNTPAYTPTEGGVFGGVVAFAFAYEGWILATSINQELKNAKRNLPLALIGGSLFVTIVYCLYIFAMGYVGDVATIQATWPLGETLPKIAFSAMFGNVIGTIVYVFITISCLGTMNGLIMSSARGLYSVSARGLGPKPEFFGDVDKQNNFVIKSGVFGMAMGGFWYGWNAMMWLDGPDFFAHVHQSWWVGWEGDEIAIICLYALYIPMMIGLMAKAKEFGFFKRFILPGLGVCCCIFMCYCCWVGKNPQQIFGFLIFFAVVMFIGWLFKRGQDDSKKELK